MLKSKFDINDMRFVDMILGVKTIRTKDGLVCLAKLTMWTKFLKSLARIILELQEHH